MNAHTHTHTQQFGVFMVYGQSFAAWSYSEELNDGDSNIYTMPMHSIEENESRLS